MTRRTLAWPSAVAAALASSPAAAATLEVGPKATYTTIADAVAAAHPGDVVEVQGDQTYAGTIIFTSDQSGTATQPVTVRGVPVNGHRPILTGVGPGQYDNMVVLLGASHFVLSSFEVIGDGQQGHACVLNMADDVTLTDLVVHDCLWQGGLVGNDSGSGSLTLQYSEFFHNGNGEDSHQIYMATDEAMFPGSVFRMQYNYLHDALGGNGVQSRAERNEIYYNWIEDAEYHELDLIGSDVGGPKLAREDSDVVGNVLVATSQWSIARIGGDGSGNSAGRYRFVNNTMVLAEATTVVIALQETVDTLEMYNNVIWGPTPGFQVYDINEPIGPAAVLYGSNNWVPKGTTMIPSVWVATDTGSDPGWVDRSMDDLRPTPASPLVGQGSTMTASMGDLAFPNPLMLPAFNPPERRPVAPGSAEMRTFTGAPSLGAFEPTAPAPGPPLPPPPPEKATSSGGSCKCRMGEGPGDAPGWLAMTAACVALGLRRRPRHGERLTQR